MYAYRYKYFYMPLHIIPYYRHRLIYNAGLRACSKEGQECFMPRESDGVSSWDAKALYLLAIFKSGTPSMQSTMPNCRGYFQRLSEPNTRENWRKVSYFIRTLFQPTSHWFLWLLCALWVWAVWSPSLFFRVCPSDSHLNPIMLWYLVENQYRSEDGAISDIDELFDPKRERFFTNEIQSLHNRWELCVYRKDDNVKD